MTFPDGRAGLGLLLLRAALGSTSVIKGAAYLFGQDAAPPVAFAGGLAAVGGVALLVGCLTPVACVLTALCSAAATLPWSAAAGPPDDWLSLLFVSSVAAAVLLLGPGAFSLDAHLFGRREIIIPLAYRAPKS